MALPGACDWDDVVEGGGWRERMSGEEIFVEAGTKVTKGCAVIVIATPTWTAASTIYTYHSYNECSSCSFSL